MANHIHTLEKISRSHSGRGEYDTEESLVTRLLGVLRSVQCPWGTVSVSQEFDYRTGRTDVVALTQGNEIIAFEAKLARWRTALHQAFRNTFFSHYSYVILPEPIALNAIAHSREFEIRRVGLCIVTDCTLQVLLPAPKVDPINAWLSAKAAGMIRQANGYSTH